MPVGLPEWQNIITAGDTEKNDVIFSKRQASIQSVVGPLNSAVGSGERYELPSGVQGGAPVEIEHLKYCYTIPKWLWFFIFWFFWLFVFTR